MDDMQIMHNYSAQKQKPDIDIRQNGLFTTTTISKDAVERIRSASWEDIRTVKDEGFQMIARTIKDRQARNEGV